MKSTVISFISFLWFSILIATTKRSLGLTAFVLSFSVSSQNAQSAGVLMPQVRPASQCSTVSTENGYWVIRNRCGRPLEYTINCQVGMAGCYGSTTFEVDHLEDKRWGPATNQELSGPYPAMIAATTDTKSATTKPEITVTKSDARRQPVSSNASSQACTSVNEDGEYWVISNRCDRSVEYTVNCQVGIPNCYGGVNLEIPPGGIKRWGPNEGFVLDGPAPGLGSLQSTAGARGPNGPVVANAEELLRKECQTMLEQVSNSLSTSAFNYVRSNCQALVSEQALWIAVARGQEAEIQRTNARENLARAQYDRLQAENRRLELERQRQARPAAQPYAIDQALAERRRRALMEDDEDDDMPGQSGPNWGQVIFEGIRSGNAAAQRARDAQQAQEADRARRQQQLWDQERRLLQERRDRENAVRRQQQDPDSAYDQSGSRRPCAYGEGQCGVDGAP